MDAGNAEGHAFEAIEGTEAIDLPIFGMSCASCVERVRGALAGMPGVERVDVRIGRAHLDYWPQAVSEVLLREKVEELGYRVTASMSLLDRMGDANDKALEGFELDCCKMKKKGE